MLSDRLNVKLVSAAKVTNWEFGTNPSGGLFRDNSAAALAIALSRRNHLRGGGSFNTAQPLKQIHPMLRLNQTETQIFMLEKSVCNCVLNKR
ncbi:hypothetical protein O181_007529 [Austropuccinia psidii MF-1]|uniref:Uncharacterized protein n=1 Tax=Austropuccinia psidii MF-1 TaxID=1389203 RepID=A0A9Q3GHZ2_9BASI|nr:hypothetical protein [Austropuccinia psidii MF-1]